MCVWCTESGAARTLGGHQWGGATRVTEELRVGSLMIFEMDLGITFPQGQTSGILVEWGVIARDRALVELHP